MEKKKHDKKLYCLLIGTKGNNQDLDYFLENLRKTLNIVYDEINSEDEHNWIFFLKADDSLIEEVKKTAETRINSLKYVDAFPVASPNGYTVKLKGDKTIILNPKYGILKRTDF
jgi:hypothetical protein